MPDILISDPTLRDGNHAIRHRLTTKQIAAYAAAAETAGVPIVEVGHGNGLGASSLQVGESSLSDREALEAFYLRGQSLKQMATEFDAPIGTIKRRLHVARQRLKDVLEADGDVNRKNAKPRRALAAV